MADKCEKRRNQFIVNLTDEEAENLRELAKNNDHTPSTQAYILVRNSLRETKGTR